MLALTLITEMTYLFSVKYRYLSGSFRWQSLPRFFRGTLLGLNYGTWESANG